SVSSAARRPCARERRARVRRALAQSAPIGEFLAIDGGRFHFIRRGDPDAPPLVMFHGNGALLQDLTISGLVDAASKKFRVICFDRPGFGHSSRPRTFVWSLERQAEVFAA